MTLLPLDRHVLALMSDWEERPSREIAQTAPDATRDAVTQSCIRLTRLGLMRKRTNPERPIEMLYRADPERCRELLAEVMS